MPEHSFIPFHLPSIGDEEIREVEATLRSGWLTTGPRTAQFEKEFGDYVGAQAIAVNSATAGLHVTLAALGIGEGDEVITSPLTFCSTVHTILQVGAKPVLADVDEGGSIDPDEVAKAITNRTRAIIPVHLGGLPCDMRAIWDLARRHGLFVIEDAAHAAGAYYQGRPIGMAGHDRETPSSDAVVFSFYATKNLTTGEGGMITTGRESLAARMRMLSLHGMSRDAWNRYTGQGSWYYEVVAQGFKYNLSDLQSALGIPQLRKLDSFVRTRARYAEIYNRVFEDLAEVEIPPDRRDCRHAWHLYMLRLNLERLRIDRHEFIEQMRLRGVGTSVHFIPIPRHPFFARMSLGERPCRRALKLYPRLVSLPLYPAMSEDQVRYVAHSVRDVLVSSCARARAVLSEVG